MTLQMDRKTIRALIVDDEALARRILREHLAEHPDVEILGECANGFETVKAAAELKPDLIFLDIQMPKLNGFEVLELLDTRELVVIFVTAYDSYALRAFEVHAVDYLLKPFSPERLAEALIHARARFDRREPLPVASLAAVSRPEGRLQRIVLKDGGRVHIIPVETIDYVEAQDDYVCFKCGGKEYLKQQTIGELEKYLDPAQFIRIHRSYLVNLDRLSRLELMTKDSRTAILRDGSQLPVSRSGYARLKSLM